MLAPSGLAAPVAAAPAARATPCACSAAHMPGSHATIASLLTWPATGRGLRAGRGQPGCSCAPVLPGEATLGTGRRSGPKRR